MRTKHPDANITLKRRSFVPGLLPQENEQAAKLALQWTGGNRTYAVPYATEAGIFRGHGIPTVICGPGDIAQAHQPNEFVARSQTGCLRCLPGQDDRLGGKAVIVTAELGAQVDSVDDARQHQQVGIEVRNEKLVSVVHRKITPRIKSSRHLHALQDERALP